MDLDEILKKYSGSKLSVEKTTCYERWAMSYFHDESIVSDPYLAMTLQLDLSQARNTYESDYRDTAGASFQAYLVWNLARALKSEWIFNTRNIEGTWYQFDNLPIFMPTAIGGELRFKDVILNDVASSTWEEFARYYRSSIDDPTAQFEILPQNVWSLCTFIGNLPDMPFTGFQLHKSRKSSGRPSFYFGRRDTSNGQCKVPLSISFDHANSDPFVLNKLIQIFIRLSAGENFTSLKQVV